MDYDAGVVLFFGARCKRRDLLELVGVPSCKHKEAIRCAYCPTCGKETRVDLAVIEGYNIDDKTLTTKNHRFEVLRPNHEVDAIFVGLKLAETGFQETVVGLDIRHGIDQLDKDAMAALIVCGIAREFADFRLWIILQESF
jgi:hypothetical protein